MKFESTVTSYRLLYLVPLVAIFFDLLVMGQHFSVRRIGAFLRLAPQNETEADFEQFVSEHRDNFFKWGSRGFTILTYLAAIALLWATRGRLGPLEWTWFGLLFVGFIAMMNYAGRILADLDSQSSEDIEAIRRKRDGGED